MAKHYTLLALLLLASYQHVVSEKSESKTVASSLDRSSKEMTSDTKVIEELNSTKKLAVSAEENLKDVNVNMTTYLQNLFPQEVVEGPKEVEVSLKGDVSGSPLAGIENLLRESYGGGKENMKSLAGHIYARSYLGIRGRLTAQLKTNSTEFILQGYQRELGYRRKDGSFSAFGDHDIRGSTWLTAFVVKVFTEAKDEIKINPNVVEDAIEWLIKQRKNDGTFQESGVVLHESMQGGSGKSSRTLTAYCAISLIETSRHNFVSQKNISSTIKMLKSTTLDNLYEKAIVFYALSLHDPESTTDLHEELNTLAVEKDGMKYWSYPMNHTDSPGISKTNIFVVDRALEMTSYVLLALVELADTHGLSEALKETVVVLQALTAVDMAMKRLTVTALAPSNFTETFTINATNIALKQMTTITVKHTIADTDNVSESSAMNNKTGVFVKKSLASSEPCVLPPSQYCDIEFLYDPEGYVCRNLSSWLDYPIRKGQRKGNRPSAAASFGCDVKLRLRVPHTLYMLKTPDLSPRGNVLVQIFRRRFCLFLFFFSFTFP